MRNRFSPTRSTSWALTFTLVVVTVASMGCPSNTPPAAIVWPISGTTQMDGPLSSTFGPRLKASEADRYDFHRGIDIPTPVGSDAHAIADGTVRLAGNYSNYTDTVIQIAHADGKGGTYYSNYIHMSEVLVSEDDVVEAGDVVGKTGAGESGFPHLHFEIRDAGLFQRNCINPFGKLPYPDENAPSVTIDEVDTTTPTNPIVTVTVSLPRADDFDELDFNAVTVSTWQKSGETTTLLDEQSFDMNQWNFEFTPLSPEDATVNLDDADYNGVHVEPESFVTASTEYVIHFTFNELTGPANPSNLVVRAVATDVKGNANEDEQ